MTTTIATLNTDAQLSGKTLLDAEDAQTITGSKLFDRDPNPPFGVSAASAVVANLDADKLDGLEAAAFALLAGATFVGDLKFTDALYDIGKTGATRPRDGFFSRNLTVGGIATITGGQIVFPAAQAASGGANTLDDYEEGVWTPVIGGSGGTTGQTYTTQNGRYTKFGHSVIATASVALSAKGTITGNVILSGLPFTAAAGTDGLDVGTFHIAYFNGMATNWIMLGGHVTGGSTTGVVYGTQAAGAATIALTTTDVSNTTRFILTVMYEAAN